MFRTPERADADVSAVPTLRIGSRRAGHRRRGDGDTRTPSPIGTAAGGHAPIRRRYRLRDGTGPYDELFPEDELLACVPRRGRRGLETLLGRSAPGSRHEPVRR
ncbi:MAG: hypothetical protein S0880_21995 [Actinomycetota bacterium]|nr:hypothetical protein [Actinomycetota bacterium]